MTNEEIESTYTRSLEELRQPWESDDMWDLRKSFVERHWKTIPLNRLICLGQIFVNVEFMGCRCFNNLMAGQQLGGVGTIVEIDESMFFQRKYNRGAPPVFQGWVFGMVQRGTNDVLMFEVPQRDAATLIPLVQQHVRPGSRIISDGWRAYGGLGAVQQAYQHDVIVHQLHFVDPNDPSIHTQSIEATWGALKRDMKSLCGTSRAMFPTYLFNYMFRRHFNRRDIFNHFWQQATIMYPVPA